MEAFDILGDPVRRRILELMAERSDRASGDIVSAIYAEFGISQSAVSQHLKVLRDNGFATVKIDGARRLYSLDPAPMLEVDDWLSQFRQYWEPKLDALEIELARGRRARRDQDPKSDDSVGM